MVRPDNFPFALSLRLRELVARGSILYSALTQPLPLSFKKWGTRFSIVAEQTTCVSPKEITTDPSGCLKTLVLIVTGRICCTARPSCLILLIPF